MLDQVFGDQLEALLSADHGFEAGPFGLELLLLLASSPSVTSSKSGSIFGLLRLLQLELGQPALVVDRDGGLVFDGALDVVDVDVVAEDGRGAGSSVSMGVPVKPMNEALGSASRMCLAKP